MDNMQLWNAVCVTDPGAVKPITGKQYRGNSPKPYWLIQRATEEFGPCGQGWGIEIASERFERFGETEALHIAHVVLWYMRDGKRCCIEQMGQTRAAYQSAAGKYIVDEDAPKKSVTDGMVKCLSMLGFAGDIFSGRWDDSRYVEWAAEETRKRTTPRVTEAQAQELQRAIEETESDEGAFLGWVAHATGMGVQSVADVPAEFFERAAGALAKKRKPAQEEVIA